MLSSGLLFPITWFISIFTYGENYNVYSTTTGQFLYSYQDKGFSEAYWHYANKFFALPLVSAQFLLGGTLLISYLAAGFVANGLGALIGAYKPLEFTPQAIAANFNNNNHHQWMKNIFRKFLGIENLNDEQVEVARDLEYLVLKEGPLRSELANVIKDLLANESTQDKNTLRFAQAQMANKAYIPSQKLLEKVYDEPNVKPELKQACANLIRQHKAFEKRFAL